MEWEDPPTGVKRGPLGRSTEYQQVSKELRANPGRWAVIEKIEGDSRKERAKIDNYASGVRTGTIRAFSPEGSYEAITRTVDNITKLYARYIGTE